jgi:cell division protein FtsL
MLKVVNLVLIVVVVVIAFSLISKRYQSRLHYAKLDGLKTKTEELDQEYSRLQIEEGTYSSNLVLQDVAMHKLNLIQPTKQNIVGIK